MAARIDQHSLAWSDKTDRDIHPLALIELVTNATIFYKAVINDFHQMPDQILFALDLQYLHHENKPVRLPAGGLSGNYGFWGPRRDAPANDWHTHDVVDTSTYNPERTAFLLLRELYAWFGHTEEDLPYTEGIGDEKRISTNAITAMG